jgi:cell division protein FtsL
MESVKSLTQAYSQTPWRKQLQVIVSFLLVLVLAALVAGVYLSISARTVAVGHDIQTMRGNIEEMQRKISDLETRLAFITSTNVMEARALELGFRPATGNQMMYLDVPGYTRRKEAVIAPPPGPVEVESRTYSPAFGESLLDWLKEHALKPVMEGEVLP